MCGIAAASPATNIAPALLEDLRKFEYWGCDSAGIAQQRVSGGIAVVMRIGEAPSFAQSCSRFQS